MQPGKICKQAAHGNIFSEISLRKIEDCRLKIEDGGLWVEDLQSRLEDSIVQNQHISGHPLSWIRLFWGHCKTPNFLLEDILQIFHICQVSCPGFSVEFMHIMNHTGCPTKHVPLTFWHIVIFLIVQNRNGGQFWKALEILCWKMYKSIYVT